MTDDDFMRDVLQRIATGPTLSKDLPREDATRAMQIILNGNADEVQAGIFFIALRMKRETNDELIGILDAINSSIAPVQASIDELLTIVDPYDGYLRGSPSAPFLPAVLAACGYRVLTHGLESMGPKFGATHHAVLRAVGYTTPSSKPQVVSALEDASIGWCYASQQLLAPQLAALAMLRTRIVKRPSLTTIEVALNSIVPIRSSHLVTGFVHKPYPPIYAALAEAAGFSSSLLVRGVEGGVVPSLSQPGRYFKSVVGKDLTQVDINPAHIGIDRAARAVPLPATLQTDSVRSVKAPGNPFAEELATYSANLGMRALNAEHGCTRDSLVYAAAVILHGRGSAGSMPEAADRVREVLDNGSALGHFNAGLKV
jgi:anthranilate phosphoribosyltransferase